MRIALAFPLILALGLAGAAGAQPAASLADSHAQTVSTAVSLQKAEPVSLQARAQPENPEAAAALLIAIRHAKDLERMAKLACAAGDTSKCQAPKAATSAPSS
ncbi:MAG TPA: hypothetical protein VHN39_10675 [Phenylobacterium sp.]|nr:hypothetical protein [Phenylobacterium sp.]